MKYKAPETLEQRGKVIKEPDWLTSFEQSLITSKAIILTGNIRDLFPISTDHNSVRTQWLPIIEFLGKYLSVTGYDIIGIYDIVGERTERTDSNSLPTRRFVRLVKGEGQIVLPSPQSTDVENFLAAFRLALRDHQKLTAFIVDYADKIFRPPESQGEVNRRCSVLLQKIVEEGAENVREGYNNVIILLFPIENQIPIDLYYNNPLVKIISIPKPDRATRRRYWDEMITVFYPYTVREIPDREKEIDDMVSLTEGFFIKELGALIEISGKVRIQDPKRLVHLFRFGRRESPWTALSPQRMQEAQSELQRRVKGQDKAIKAVCDMLLIAQTGVGDYLNPNRPKGVFFFVGPTGVGKTELAKALANFLFGSDDAMIRFDMSEYSQEHAGERLVGAPPGYVGFERGGQLVNAVREKPFSVILFDEIEKAHGRILDKFLQILDDGRLTDGRGITAYFADTVIIFTSNIGQIYDIREDEVQTEEAREDIRRKNEEIRRFIYSAPYDKNTDSNCISSVTLSIYNREFTNLVDYFRAAVEHYFRNKLQRPELLRRIGYDNIIVFNRITDDLKKEIVRAKLDDFGQKLYTSSIGVRGFVYDENLVDFLASHPEGFEKGGAGGMMNLIREYVVKRVAFKIARNNLINKTLRIQYDSSLGDVVVYID